MLSRVLVTLWILTLSIFSISASPLYYRSPLSSLPVPTSPAPSSTTASNIYEPKNTASPESSTLRKNGSDVGLDWMWLGNEAFHERKDDIMEQIQDAPKALFLGCSDSKLRPDVIFQADVGTTTSHFNLGNQFSSQDYSSASAINYAIQELKVKHIVVVGHYGCKSVEKSIDQLSKTKSAAIQKWLQPMADLYSRSKRFEIRRLRVLRKGSDLKSTADATPSGLRALVEENVKASVQNLQNEIKTLLGENAYNKEVELYGHGIVIDEETGDVKDLNVSFGPPGKDVVEMPFDKVPKARMHIPFGKFQSRKKKVSPTPMDGVQATFSTSDSA